MKRLFLAVAIFLSGMTAAVHPSGSAAPPAQDGALSKIAPWVLAHTADGQEAEFLVLLAEQADLGGAARFATKKEKNRYVRDTLWRTAQETQAPLLAWLRERQVKHRSFYIVNMVLVQGGRDLAQQLAARPEVARLIGNPEVRNHLTATPAASDLGPAPLNPTAIEPGITNVRAPEVWQLGFTGQGLVVGSADTGVQWDHPALRPHYRGVNGQVVSHDYNWHDSIHSGGGSCGPNTTQPCDDNNHGTHTTGTAVGDDGAGNQIGMAPGAKFIACRNMNQGVGTPATYTECFEFFLAPYPVGGTPAEGDPDQAPDVTINSWGCPPSEGCDREALQAAVEAQRAAGILTVVAAGNAGSGCSTVVDPPSFYDASYTVGAYSSSTLSIASFSSRGPVTHDQSNRVKPDLTAPGVGVRSALRNNGFGSLSGTSMATPHVSGAVALLWSAVPALRNDIDLTEAILNDAAVDVTDTRCNSTGLPNNVFGFGRLDVKAAVDLAQFTITPRRRGFTADAATATFNVAAPAGGNWTAASNAPWISVTGGSGGTGDGTVTIHVLQNAGPGPRRGTLTIAGHTINVWQGVAFSDVPSGHSFYNEIGKLSAYSITMGCAAGVFCPNAAVTREQMAAFIERALGVPTPPAPPFQRFQDVGPGRFGYAFIHDLARRGITEGCSPTLFCPDDPVTRGQMAAFIMRTLGEFNPPPPPTQRFTDVPPGHPFYNFIDRLAALGITQGCATNPARYCPEDSVTRGQMAAFLVRAFGL